MAFPLENEKRTEELGAQLQGLRNVATAMEKLAKMDLQIVDTPLEDFTIGKDQIIKGNIGQQGDIKNQGGPVNNNGASTNIGQQQNYNGYGYYGREARMNDPGFNIKGNQEINGDIGQQGDIKNQAGPVNNNGASTNVGQQT
ncbi:hypothetical protein OS493_027143 [Desmophyllum pertusum]|uniref:Uncharacterized protein n=1 Tax=Desmophyllum pertusum TaxID=174260 RepID=A0A9W9ZZ06_9CNID|nr:hypothetical protein OS493_027143 [Desmophyllum pertusum]